jgi:hypothetical protein
MPPNRSPYNLWKNHTAALEPVHAVAFLVETATPG